MLIAKEFQGFLIEKFENVTYMDAIENGIRSWVRWRRFRFMVYRGGECKCHTPTDGGNIGVRQKRDCSRLRNSIVTIFNSKPISFIS
ncbi:hypothetical protein HanRHA438_Chr15g0693881 [Helianthus annuus]|nr:hypothetical protein HanIR_Chr15g0740461 [Helianthus annuus]KAJ0843674.1 hypothetical protein HanRHA438_Chr15g0693881 [Helianthus annuus]